MRSVFSVSVKEVRLGNGGPRGHEDSGWRVAMRLARGAGRSAANVPRNTIQDLLNVFFPTDCRVCGAALIEAGPVRVCRDCLAGVGEQAGCLCSRCGTDMGWESARFAASLGASECATCRLAPPEFAAAVSHALYEGEARELLHQLKFNGDRALARHALGTRLAQTIAGLRARTSSELVVVPVPLFRGRERERGFNQASLLAKAAIRVLRRKEPGWKLVYSEALERTRDTRPLYLLASGQRTWRLKGAFAVPKPERVRGREVLLVDDIMTTGATARECSRVLMRAGAEKVWVATVARAQPETLRFGADRDARAGVARWD